MNQSGSRRGSGLRPSGAATQLEQQGGGIEDHHEDQQHAIAQQHTEVLHAASHHNAQQVGGKGDISRQTVAERIGEDDVGQEDRRERQGACHNIADNRVAEQQRFGGQQDIEQQDAEQQQVKHPDALELEAAIDHNSQQDAAQDGEEDQGVDQPGVAEQQREGGQTLDLQQHERYPQAEHVQVKTPQHFARRQGQRAHQRKPHHHQQSQNVERRKTLILQVQERPVVGRRGSRGKRVEALPHHRQRRGVRISYRMIR